MAINDDTYDFPKTVWDDIVDCFDISIHETIQSRGKQNFDAVMPVLINTIDNFQIKTDLRNQRVLDFGCGTGYFAEALSRIGFDVFACDISAEMIKKARSISQNRVIYEVGSIDVIRRQLPFQLIISVMVFQFISDIELVVTSLAEKLADNGVLFFVVHNVEHIEECRQASIKFRGFSENDFSENFSPKEGEIFIDSRWIPIYVRSPKWYEKILADNNLIKIDNFPIGTTLSPDISQSVQNKWQSPKYYMSWFKKQTHKHNNLGG